MTYIYLLVLFLRTTEPPGFMPLVIDQGYETKLACHNAGLAAKLNSPNTVVWFECNRMPEE